MIFNIISVFYQNILATFHVFWPEQFSHMCFEENILATID
jgi:hypothetical protein